MGTIDIDTPAATSDDLQWTKLIEHVSSGHLDLVLVCSNGGRAALVSESYLDQLRRSAEGRPPLDNAQALSARETEVLSLAAEGHTGAHIANTLGLAVNTVAQHLVSARRKLGVRTTKDAIARAAALTDRR